MFKNLRFPLAHILELLFTVPLFASFYFVVAFVASEPANRLRAAGASIPQGWEAGVANHGRYLPGFLPSSHPVLFALALAALVVFAVVAWQLRLAQSAQQRAATAEQAQRHKVASAITFVAWGAIGWAIVTQVLPRLAAA